jgi:hypothetical protein
MEEKELKKFSLTALFFVTGICFLIFTKALWLIDGTRLPVFSAIGYIAILLGIFNMLRNRMTSTEDE